MFNNTDESFLAYCNGVILEKEKGELHIEEAAYKICSLISTDLSESAKEVVSYACQLETPREMSVGAGINIGEKWDEQEVATYKEKGWQKLVDMIKEIKKPHIFI